MSISEVTKAALEIITPAELRKLWKLSPAATWARIQELEALGLKRKSRGRGTHWLARDFARYYEKWDTRTST